MKAPTSFLLLIFCFSLQVSSRDYVTSFSLKVQNQLNKPLLNAITHHVVGETLELMEALPAFSEGFFQSVNQDFALNSSTVGLLSFQLSDYNSSNLYQKYFLTILWSISDTEEQNIFKLALTSNSAQNRSLFDDVYSSNTTFDLETGNTWQEWQTNFTDITVRAFCNNEYAANASIIIFRRTPDFSDSSRIAPYSRQNLNLQLFGSSIELGIGVSVATWQAWTFSRAYDDVFHIINFENLQYVYAQKTSASTGVLFASAFLPENNNNLWEIKRVPFGYSIRSLQTNLYLSLDTSNSNPSVLLKQIADAQSPLAAEIFLIQGSLNAPISSDLTKSDDIFIVKINNPINFSLYMSPPLSRGAIEMRTLQNAYDDYILIKKVTLNSKKTGFIVLHPFEMNNLYSFAISTDTYAGGQTHLFLANDTLSTRLLWEIVKIDEDLYTIESIERPGFFLRWPESTSGGFFPIGNLQSDLLKNTFKIQINQQYPIMGKKNAVYMIATLYYNCLTYSPEGAKSTYYLGVLDKSNLKFNLQIRPAQAQNGIVVEIVGSGNLRLTLEGGKLVWKPSDSANLDTQSWKMIHSTVHYNINFQLQNLKTGTYLTAPQSFNSLWTMSTNPNDRLTYLILYPVI